MSYVFFMPSYPNLNRETERENMDTHRSTLKCQELNTKKEKRSRLLPQQPEGMNKVLLRHDA